MISFSPLSRVSSRASIIAGSAAPDFSTYALCFKNKDIIKVPKITTFEKGSRSIIHLKQSSLQKIYVLLGLSWNKFIDLLKLRITKGEAVLNLDDFMKDSNKMNSIENLIEFYDIRLNDGADRVDITTYSFDEILKKMSFDKNNLLEYLDFIITNEKIDYNTPHFKNLFIEG